MADKRDYYEVLGVSRNAGEDEIKRAYRALAKKYHPDVNKGDTASEQKFKEISEAHEVLSDTNNKRKKYDQFGHAGVNGNGAGAGGFGGFSGFGGVEEIFESFFGGFGGTTRRTGPRKGQDLRERITITFDESAFGVKKTINVLRHESCSTCEGTGARPGTEPETCSRCHGSGKVRERQNTLFGQMINERTCDSCVGTGKIIKEKCDDCSGSGKVRRTRKIDINVPAGIDNGHTISLRGEGEPGVMGGPPGDLLVTVTVQPHEIFIRNGTNIFLKVNISFTQAALGDEIEVPTIDGIEKYKIKSGTQPGDKFRMRGKGIPSLRTGHRGDQIVEVAVEVPKKMNRKQKEALKKYAELMSKRKR